jgi:murein DD-endopeptidase MepM/ murein hydrolase activator NlpD
MSAGAGVAAAGGGGITPPSPPSLSDVTCATDCAGVHKATEGSKVNASGRHLGGITAVLFTAEGGGRVSAEPISTSSRLVTARVPEGAATGRPKVADSSGNSARSPNDLRIVDPSEVQSGGAFKLRDADASPRRSYYYGTKRPRVRYTFANGNPTDVRVDVVRISDHSVIDSFVQENREPNTTHTASWRGTRQGTGRPAPNGAYRFRIGPTNGDVASTSDAKFQYHRFKFPVRGRHTYGDGVGAPRSGHTHQGQDVFAACGTPLVAARGGRVQAKSFQSAAGYYVVIDGKGTGHDYAYMHLRRRASVTRGERVRTGERIGLVGESGNASGCHLHFEEWSAPGWYEGGSFLKAVTRHLKQWDSWS